MDFTDFTFESGALEVLDFLQRCLPSMQFSHIDSTNIMDFLRSGVVLCDALIALEPNFVPQPINSPDCYARNIEYFLDGCRRIGVPDQALFQVDDLLRCTNPDMVMLTICCVSRIVSGVAQQDPVDASQQQQQQQPYVDEYGVPQQQVPPQIVQPPPTPTQQQRPEDDLPDEIKEFSAVNPNAGNNTGDKRDSVFGLDLSVLQQPPGFVDELEAALAASESAKASVQQPVHSQLQTTQTIPESTAPTPQQQPTNHLPPHPVQHTTSGNLLPPHPGQLPQLRPASGQLPPNMAPQRPAADSSSSLDDEYGSSSVTPGGVPPPVQSRRPPNVLRKSLPPSAVPVFPVASPKTPPNDLNEYGTPSAAMPQQPHPPMMGVTPGKALPTPPGTAAANPPRAVPSTGSPQLAPGQKLQSNSRPLSGQYTPVSAATTEKGAPQKGKGSFWSKWSLAHKEKKDKKAKDKHESSDDVTPVETPTSTTVTSNEPLPVVAVALRKSLTASGEESRAAFQILTESLMNVDDVVNAAVSLNQTHPLSASRRGERYAIENAALQSFIAVLQDKIALERQRAMQLQQGNRISQLDRCADALGLEAKIPRDLLVHEGKVDVALENLIIKLEIRGLLYELAALKTAVNIGEECANLTVKTVMLQEGIKKAESERKEADLLLRNALAFNETNKDCVQEEGLLLSKVEGSDKLAVKGGTVVKLIDRLFNLTIDKDFTDVFLLTYRSFTDAQTVLRETIHKFNDAKENPDEGEDHSILAMQMSLQNKKIRQRVGVFLKEWLSKHFYDFEQEPALLAEMKQFIAENPNETLFKDRLMNIINQAEDPNQRTHFSFIFSTAAPVPIVPASASFDDIDPLELARQLSIYEYRMLCKIRSCELLSCGWAKKDKEKRSPNLLKMIDHFNDVTSFVSVSICSERDVRKRASIVRKVLRVIEEAQKLNNFFAVFELSAGLNCSAVNRLKLTWEEVAKEKVSPEKVMALTSPQSNFSAYRNQLRIASGPVIPYLGQYLSDLTFIEDGNPDTLENGYVNFEKCQMVAKAILNMKQFQDAPYNLEAIDMVQEWISTWKSLSEKEIFDMSLIAEPRAPRPQQ